MALLTKKTTKKKLLTTRVFTYLVDGKVKHVEYKDQSTKDLMGLTIDAVDGTARERFKKAKFWHIAEVRDYPQEA